MQIRARSDHLPSHGQHSAHAPLQKPMLKARNNGKRAKEKQEKKQIVDAESLLEQVAGKEFEGRLGAAEIEHSESKEDGDCDPAETGDSSLANLDLVRAAVEYAQGQRDRNDNEQIEGNRVKRRAHGGPRSR